MLQELLVSCDVFDAESGSEFARTAVPPDRFIAWRVRDGGWGVDDDDVSLQNDQGDPYDHAELQRFLDAMSPST